MPTSVRDFFSHSRNLHHDSNGNEVREYNGNRFTIVWTSLHTAEIRSNNTVLFTF